MPCPIIFNSVIILTMQEYHMSTPDTSKNRKLLDEVRDVMRLHHYSIHTERTYCDWIKRYIRYHSMTCRQDLIDGEAKIEAFLTHLAVDKTVAPSTQNQAMNALVFLYKHVLKQPLNQENNAVRASRKINVPVVMTREEVAQIIALMEGVPQLVVKLLGHKDVATTMIYTHVLQQGEHGVLSSLDDLGI